LSVTCDRSVVSSTNKIDCHDITEILLKVVLNTIALTLLFCIVSIILIHTYLIKVVLNTIILTLRKLAHYIYIIIFYCYRFCILISSFFHNKVRAMVFNTTFNDISVISWQSILLVEETTDLSQVTDKLYHIKLYWIHLAWAGFELTMLVVIGTDCIGSYKSNYHTSN
jgi:hypothetical protein